MSSFFADDGDSDEERAEKQRRNLESIKAIALTEPRNGQPESRLGEKEPELLSEEQELKKLRESAIYRKYVAGRKRNRTPSPGPSKRPRSTVNEDDSEEDDEKDIGPAIAVMPESPVPVQNSQEKCKSFDVNPAARELLRKTEDTADGNKPRTAKRNARLGPKIDPKIIDDSSDDDSGSGETSDGDSDDGPIGPALPGDVAPREQERSRLETLPIQNEAVLGDSHGSYVSCITLDRAGSRIASGSIDSTVLLFDFNSMNRSLPSFRTVNPLGDAPVRNLQYSATGSLLLCSGGTNSAVVLDRDGTVLSQTAKGDMYIVDMERTKGHTGSILSAKWRPNSKIIASTSVDGTVRLWDVTRASKNPMVDNPVISQLRVTKLRNSRGGKTVAAAMDWDIDGKSCILGCSDGRIKVINPDTYSILPQDETQVVLQQGAEVSSVTVAPEACAAPLILVRSSDDSLRVFDRRKLASPVMECPGLPNAVSETNACFVGEVGQHFLTGTSAKRKGGSLRGSVRMFETKTLKEIWKLEAEEDTGSVVYTSWHKNINQIFYGTADGKVRVLYHPIESKKGILNCLVKSDFRKKHGIANVGVGEVFLPSTLHKLRSERTKGAMGADEPNRPLSNRSRREASESLKPKSFSGPRPTQGEKSKSLAKHLAAGEVAQDWTLDPRQAILRYAEVAKKDPKFTAAYRKTQPETILAEKTAEQEEDESRQAIYERDGLRKARMQSDQNRKA